MLVMLFRKGYVLNFSIICKTVKTGTLRVFLLLFVNNIRRYFTDHSGDRV